MLRKLALAGAAVFGCLSALPVAILGLIVLSAAVSAADVTAVGDKAVIVPYGDWAVAVAQLVLYLAGAILVPMAAAWLKSVVPFGTLFIRDEMVKRLVQNATDFALNAVEGAAKGQQLSVNVGSAVIAQGLQRALNQAGPKLLDAAGGPAGIAEKIFRSLNLEPDANLINTLKPALAQVPGGVVSKDVEQVAGTAR